MTFLAPLLALALALAQPGAAPPAPASAVPAAASPAPAAVQAIAAGNRQFALDLYRRLPPRRDGNLFFSPISIATAFGPASAGARGETLQALARVLHFPETGPGLHQTLGGLGETLQRDNEGIEVRIANTLWVGRQMGPRPDYLALTRDAYGAAVERIDFSQAEAAAARINARVSEQTNGRIAHLVSPDVLPPDTGMVITNAVYFLAHWSQPFEAEATRPLPFTLADGSRITVPLMAQTDAFRHYRGRGFAALDLPYRDGGYVMTVLLPDEADGLPALERSLTPALLDRTFAALDRAEPVRVDLLLPKLELRTDYLLGETLQAMGMALAFSNRADFSGIGEPPMRIGQVIHQTFLRIDEEGTEAAAATAIVEIVITGARIQARPVTFHADHPFLLLLRDRETGAILFMGRIARPQRPGG